MMNISDINFICNAYALGFKRYRLILGMDWLSYYKNILDCERRIVRLKSRMGHGICVHYTRPNSYELGRLFSLN